MEARSVSARAWHALRDRALDIGLVGCAIAFAFPSLVYPFGGDQGVHFYVGREWLHGALPYRDAFDYKPPGIFAIHALLIAVFGERQWPARVGDIACALALGVACYLLLSTRPRGALGLSCLGTSVLYFGFFSFWDTAQCELWCVMFAAFALVAARRARPSLAGVAGGLAILMKTPAILFVLLAGAILLRRSDARRQLVRFALAVFVFPALTILYFAVRGGLGAMAEALGGATWAYLVGARRVDSCAGFVRESVAMFAWFNPYATIASTVAAIAALRGLAEGRWELARRYGLSLTMGVAAYVAIALQMKFYRYHFVLLVPALVLALGEAMLVLHARRSRLAMRAAVSGLLVIFTLSGEPARRWSYDVVTFAARMGGASSRQTLARFAIPSFGYDPVESRDVGEWLRDHTRPGQHVLVRGFAPEIYAVAGRAAPGRFFWSIPLTDKLREYRLEDWRAEDRASIDRALPTFVVVFTNVQQGPESAAYFVPNGYVPEAHVGRMTILRRGPTASAFGVPPRNDLVRVD